MAKRCKGPTPKRGTRRAAAPSLGPGAGWQRQTVDVVMSDLEASCWSCVVCRGTPVNWYSRVDVLDDRLVIVPACGEHDRQAQAIACPDDTACDGLHPGLDEDLLVDQLDAALSRGMGIAFPRPEAPEVLDVIRPVRR